MPATPLAACDATTVTMPDGRVLISFGGCNYLGLAADARVIGAVGAATARFGLSSTASRETTGNAAPHDALERDLAAFLGVERALLVPDGYLANIAACQGLAAGGCTHAVLDSRAHVSMADAARTAGMSIARFDHGDAGSLARCLAAIRPARAVVMTDGVFTADGEPAPLIEYLEALGGGDRLLVDDCHGLGVLGPCGRGSVAYWGLRDARVIITSSLAKGIGVAGGVGGGAGDEVARCARATAYVCTTPIAPALAEGARAAIGVLLHEPTRVDRLATNAERLRGGLHALGLALMPTAPYTPIVAFTLADLPTMERFAAALADAGFRVPLIRYPGGPAEAYFRLSVNAEHSLDQIDCLLGAIAAGLGVAVLGVAEASPTSVLAM